MTEVGRVTIVSCNPQAGGALPRSLKGSDEKCVCGDALQLDLVKVRHSYIVAYREEREVLLPLL